ncbi:MAG: hypothetical protein A2583_01510 [Bdellovibrionales bacterium RIFOXYD1_FULL_53_11]|nr:MAG: hypothetical protein A2583_01510 [Bdellovibrionales bacterium RIFOXYD1_FULL_53_11]
MAMKEKRVCPHVYGPCKSRRMGLSLGINTGDPEIKCCTWSCVYCQYGYGILSDSTGRHASRAGIIQALVPALEKHPGIESVTFAGNCEPGTHPELLLLVQDIAFLRSSMDAKWIFNCLSNGSELGRDDVVAAFNILDEAWIKLDCGTQTLMHKLNRPLPRAGCIEGHIANIKKLREPRIQTLLWLDSDKGRGIGNYTRDNLDALLVAYKQIAPVMIHLTTVCRTSATEGLEPVSAHKLEEFALEARQAGLEVAVFP